MPEYEGLKQNNPLFIVKRNTISHDTITVFVHHVKSIPKHTDDTVSNDKIVNNDITAFTETQLNLSDSICKLIKTMILFNVNFNNNETKFLILAY